MDRQPSEHHTEVESKPEGEQKMDEIRAEMAETRASLADKLDALQEKALGTLEAAQATVEQTVETVQETVQAAKRTFDIPYQTERHPWRMFGLAVLAGSAAGYFFGKSQYTREPAVPAAAPWPMGDGKALHGTAAPSPSVSEPPSKPGLFAEEWQKLKGMAIGTGMALARDWLKEAVPGLTEQIEQLMNNATSKLGGVPTEGPIFGTAAEEQSRHDGPPRAWSAAG